MPRLGLAPAALARARPRAYPAPEPLLRRNSRVAAKLGQYAPASSPQRRLRPARRLAGALVIGAAAWLDLCHHLRRHVLQNPTVKGVVVVAAAATVSPVAALDAKQSLVISRCRDYDTMFISSGESGFMSDFARNRPPAR